MLSKPNSSALSSALADVDNQAFYAATIDSQASSSTGSQIKIHAKGKGSK